MRLETVDQLRVLDSKTTPMDVLKTITESPMQDEPFYVMDLGEVARRYEIWKEKFQGIKPFYAVKCNDSYMVLKLLAALGTGFDCASKGEIEKVLSMGVSPDRIIFANPTKMASHIRFAAKVGVDLMTFDSAPELHKIKANHPQAKLVIRIRCDATEAQCAQFGMKFGCDGEREAGGLLKLASALGLNVVGVSFHVGSGCGEATAWSRGVTLCRQVLRQAEALGQTLSLIDIGGGVPSTSSHLLDKISESIAEALEREFGPDSGVEVIAEPGRFFVASAYTLAASVHSVRDSAQSPMYYINDGVYGSFNCLLYDHALCDPIPLKKVVGEKVPSMVWGPTCDSLDLVASDVLLPRLSVGDWLIFLDMGAYTLPTTSQFNGFPKPRVHYVISQPVWCLVKEMLEAVTCLSQRHVTVDASGDALDAN